MTCLLENTMKLYSFSQLYDFPCFFFQLCLTDYELTIFSWWVLLKPCYCCIDTDSLVCVWEHGSQCFLQFSFYHSCFNYGGEYLISSPGSHVRLVYSSTYLGGKDTSPFLCHVVDIERSLVWSLILYSLWMSITSWVCIHSLVNKDYHLVSFLLLFFFFLPSIFSHSLSRGSCPGMKFSAVFSENNLPR